MSDNIGIADTAKKIIADLSGEKDQLSATIETMEAKIASLKAKISDIDSTISVLVDTYRLKSRVVEVESVKSAPAVRGRRKNVDPKKKKPIEIKAAVRDYIAGNLDFPVKALVAAVREMRPDAQQPSIQAELTKLMKAGELSRVGYGLYRSNVYTGDTAPAEAAAEAASE